MLFAENNAYTVVDIFCEFLEVAIHNILYVEKVYPDAIFECRRKYGVAVYQSIHPSVNDYILNCINSIRFYLMRNHLRGIFLCFKSAQTEKKYCFEIAQINDNLESDQFLIKLEQYFNNFCLKLHSAHSNNIVSEESTFSIQLLVTESANLEFCQDSSHETFLWVDIAENKNDSAKIIPLKNCETQFLSMQTYIKL